MFLEKTLSHNPALVEFAFYAHKKGLLPDTYLIDLDTLLHNAQRLLDKSKQEGLTLYFMLKQLGRNPAIGRLLDEMGFGGAVCVDFKEALTLSKADIHLGHVGHLVQTPKAALSPILTAKPEIVTIFSLEKAAEIEEVCRELGQTQDIMLRVVAPGDMQYPGQQAGFALDQLEQVVEKLRPFRRLRIAGVCSFPCFLYQEEAEEILPTPNLTTVLTAARQLEAMGFDSLQINTPSANCLHSLPLVAEKGGTHAEPGHGLTGTTPYHAVSQRKDEELPALVYLSEVSHSYDGTSFLYGGGYYRRGHLKKALVGENFASSKLTAVTPPSDESIDYHFQLGQTFPVSAPAVLSFRTQIFTTRSQVALVSGLRKGTPTLCGLYSATGQPLD